MNSDQTKEVTKKMTTTDTKDIDFSRLILILKLLLVKILNLLNFSYDSQKIHHDKSK